VLDAPPCLQGQPTDLHLEPDSYHHLPLRSSKIIAVGKELCRCAAEMGNSSALQSRSLLYIGYFHCRNSVSSSRLLGRLRGELALVIGDRTFDCTPEQAQTKFGATIANDVTARDLQRDSRVDEQRVWPYLSTRTVDCPGIESRARLFSMIIPSGTICCIDWWCFRQMYSYPISASNLATAARRCSADWNTYGCRTNPRGDRIRIEIEGIGRLENTVRHSRH